MIFIAVQFRAIGRCVDTIEQSLKIMDTDALNDAVSAFNDAAEQFNSIDMDGLNGAVESLRDAADTFKDIDVDSLNSLVQSLETTAEKLESAVSAIKGIFGR